MQKTWHVKCNIVQQVCLLWPFWRSWDCAASCSAVFGKMLSTARWAGDVFSKVCRLPKNDQRCKSTKQCKTAIPMTEMMDSRMISSWGFHPYDLCFSRILLAILSYHVLYRAASAVTRAAFRGRCRTAAGAGSASSQLNAHSESYHEHNPI